MSAIDNHSMRSKLLLLAGVFALGFLMFGVLAYATLDTAKVNGPYYQRIVLNKDLLADVLPPPNYIVESFLVAHSLRDASPAETERLIEHYQTLRRDYFIRQEVWNKTLEPGRLREEMIDKSRPPAEAFFIAFDRDLIPAVRRQDRAAVEKTLLTTLPPLYQEHREAVDQVVKMTTENAAATEVAVAKLITRRTWVLWLIGGGLLVAITGFTLWLRHSAAQQEMRDADNTAKVTAIGKSQAVIEFSMDGNVLTANDNFLTVTGYELDEIQGRHHSLFVDEALRQSAAYKEFWTRLVHGEYQAGEFRRIGKDGKEVWIQASYNPVLDCRGKPVKVVKYATDISAQVRQREQLARGHVPGGE